LKIRRFTAAAAMLAAGSLVLAACGDGGGADPADPDAGDTDDSGIDDDSGISQDQALTVGWNQPFFEYNDDSLTGNATANAVVLYMIRSGFNYYDADLNLVQDESFGTYEKISDDPLQVKYTFADTAEWSDGTPVDAADLVMYWGAKNQRFNTVEAEYDEDFEVTNEEEVEAGVFFNATSASVSLIEEFPEISDDGKSVTFTYTQPYGDWEVNMEVGVPAHVVAMNALNISDAQEAKDAVIDAFQDEDEDALSALSEFWNEGFQFDSSLPEDESLYLSSGPYLLTELREDQYVTLEKNPDYKGDHQVSIDKVTIQYSESPEAHVQALENGDIDLIGPQATADILTSLEQLGDDYTVNTGEEGTYEHIDLAFDNGGPFDPATYDGDEEAALKVRQAFLKLIPREEIVEKLVLPLNPDGHIRNSYTVIPGSPMYDDMVAANGMSEYDEVDLEGAKALLDEVGVETPIDVRLMFAKGNERRENQYSLIAESVGQDDLFNLINSSDAEWGTLIADNSTYDASLFGWQSTSTAVTESDATYRTGGLNNHGGYSNEDVDGWYDELQVATEEDEQQELLTKIETQLVDDAFGLTLWQFPAVSAYNNSLQGVEEISISPTIFHGFWNWTYEG